MINFNQLETLNKCLIDWNVNYSIYPYNGYTINEVLCQFFDAINKGIITINEYTKLICGVMDWIKKEGLKEEVEKALDKMVQDGTLETIINENLFQDLNNKIDEIKNHTDDKLSEFEKKMLSTLEEVKEYAKQLVERKNTTVIYILKNEHDYGDSSLIKADDGTFTMIDCMWETNRDTLFKQLDKIGLKKLKYLLITHDHSDHIGNAPEIIRRYKPQYIVYKDGIDYDRLPQAEHEWDTKGYHERMLQACRENGVELIPARDQRLNIGENDYVQVYNSTYYDYSNLNGMSLTFVLNSCGTKSVFPGDSPAGAENNLRGRIGKVDLLKLSHHGADGGNTDAWFDELKPLICAINRTNDYNTYIVENNALKGVLRGGKVYSNDNNEFMCFKVYDGHISVECNETPFPLKFITVGDNYKFTDSTGNLAKPGIYPYKTDHYFIKDNGFVAMKEWVKLHGVDYYAGKSGALVKNDFIEGTDDGRPVWYWLNSKGELVQEWEFVTHNNNNYIIKPNGMMVANGWTSFQGKQYYADTNGVLFFEKWHQDPDGKYYYFYSDCSMVKSARIFINGKWYTFDDNGACTNPEGEQA